ncbi:ATP-binding protein [Hyalangium rubrum]|uniref:histidine kinase n=1 Tax=Hyalangium rubrum TaxID=3103134 RepID=A0ABU5GW42_9BACT|nr:ATP-binding protein [Hyalangium sp. s54d21]MDY7225394.1 ATP-binding protein [Hyalangium sp. s54d21]
MALQNLSLRARLVLLVALLFAAFALFFLIFFPARMDEQARHWMLDRAMGVAQLLAGATEPALDFGDASNAQRHLETLRSTPDATFGLLLREDGTVLASWYAGHVRPIPRTIPEGAWILGQEAVSRVNIQTRGGQRGALLLGLSLAEVRRESQRTLRLAAIISAMIFGFGMLAAFGVGTVLVRPLGRVTQVALRISEGELGAQKELDLSRRDETGTLAAALSRMLHRLYEQKALIESQSEASSEGILTVSGEGALLAHNQRFLQLWQLPPERLEGHHLEELFQRLTPLLREPEVLRRLADFSREPPASGAVELGLKDGRTLTAYRAPIQSQEGTRFGWGLYFQDITARLAQERVLARNAELEQRVAERTEELARRLTELREAQEQLITADRRTSVGTLAAGVAHEINNPLAYVTSNIQFVLRELPELRASLVAGDSVPAREPLEETWQEVADALAEAREGCSRVQNIVQGLKSFSRGDDDTRKPVDISHTLEAAIGMAANELRHRARLVRDYQPVPCVEANEVHLIQVFLNLLINAAHAIEPGAADQNEVRITTWRGEDGQVRVSITDTGSGMSPEVRGRLFTPFFTTKPVGVGTGLGLSVCQGIITRLGGRIDVHSEPGQGSAFTVVMPAASVSASTPFPGSPTVNVHAARRGGRVLVVDDDPFVRAALRRALGREHDITLAASAREALGRILQGGTFDLILCDLMMPEMTGMEFFAELQRLCPSQAEEILFFTGGAFTEATRGFIETQAGRVLNKPIDTSLLLESIQARLARRAPSVGSLAAPMV